MSKQTHAKKLQKVMSNLVNMARGQQGLHRGPFVSLSDVDSLRGQKPPEIDGTRCSTVATNPSSSSLAVNQSDN